VSKRLLLPVEVGRGSRDEDRRVNLTGFVSRHAVGHGHVLDRLGDLGRAPTGSCDVLHEILNECSNASWQSMSRSA
jgi:hypothetical protein